MLSIYIPKRVELKLIELGIKSLGKDNGGRTGAGSFAGSLKGSSSGEVYLRTFA